MALELERNEQPEIQTSPTTKEIIESKKLWHVLGKHLEEKDCRHGANQIVFEALMS